MFSHFHATVPGQTEAHVLRKTAECLDDAGRDRVCGFVVMKMHQQGVATCSFHEGTDRRLILRTDD